MEHTTNIFDDPNILILRVVPAFGDREIVDQVTGNPSGKVVGSAHILYFNTTTKTLHSTEIAIDYEAYPEPEFDHTDNQLTIEEAQKLLDEAGINY